MQAGRHPASGRYSVIQRGPLPIQEALTIAAQIAGALDKAHRAGVVHRDLKPGNIMLTKAGARLLDFGLAKTTPRAEASAGLSMLPTTPPNLTAEGTILGTAQYMSPEQLEGREADARTDIFAFGAVVYEMVTGRKAFEGRTQASLIASIMSGQPPAMTALQPLTPQALDPLVQTCLAKDPADRWQSAHDLSRQLQWIARSGSTPTGAAARLPQSPWRERLAWALAGIVGVAFLVALTFAVRGGSQPVSGSDVVRLSLAAPGQMTVGLGFALSPDGTRLAFSATGPDGKSALWIRALDQTDAQKIAGTDDAVQPFWSPDGRFVAFFANGKLKKMAMPGGSPETICDATTGFGGAWGADGTILFIPGWAQPIVRVPATGGTPAPATKIEAAKGSAWVLPKFLPDGRHFLYFVRSSQREVQGIYVASLDSSETTRIIANADSAAQFAPPGFLLFLREGALVAQPFDATSLKVAGDVTTIAPGVQLKEDENYGWFAVSKNGRLVYRPARPFRSQLEWVDAEGKGLSAVAADADSAISLSPDEKRVTIDREDPQTGAGDVWLLDIGRGIASTFSVNPAADSHGVWSPDGTRIAFQSDRDGARYYNLNEKPAAGGDTTLLFKSDQDKTGLDWSRDGRWLLFRSRSKDTKSDLYMLSMTGERKAAPFLVTPFDEGGGRFSPDGHWIAYVSNKSGQEEVYVQPFPPTSAKWQISVGGGNSARWSGDGRELFYASPDRKLMAVAITYQPALEPAAPKPVFDLKRAIDFDVSRMSRRFLVNQPVIDAASTSLEVVLNWPAVIKK